MSFKRNLRKIIFTRILSVSLLRIILKSSVIQSGCCPTIYKNSAVNVVRNSLRCCENVLEFLCDIGPKFCANCAQDFKETYSYKYL